MLYDIIICFNIDGMCNNIYHRIIMGVLYIVGYILCVIGNVCINNTNSLDHISNNRVLYFVNPLVDRKLQGSFVNRWFNNKHLNIYPPIHVHIYIYSFTMEYYRAKLLLLYGYQVWYFIYSSLFPLMYIIPESVMLVTIIITPILW